MNSDDESDCADADFPCASPRRTRIERGAGLVRRSQCHRRRKLRPAFRHGLEAHKRTPLVPCAVAFHFSPLSGDSVSLPDSFSFRPPVHLGIDARSQTSRTGKCDWHCARPLGALCVVPMPTPLLQLDKVTIRFGGLTAVNGVDLTVNDA